MFVGRTNELVSIQNALLTPGSAVMIYGKRKVGKTTLIKEALQNVETINVYYECIKGSLEENISLLTQELVRTGILPAMLVFQNFQDLFSYLDSLAKHIVIVIDEYPYLKVTNEGKLVDSIFQTIIDNRLKNMNLILSGSHVGMMKEMLGEDNSLYGRFQTVIRLGELSYLETSAFYPDKTAYEKAGFFCVFGGSPYINEQLNPHSSLKENILNTVLNTGSAVSLYADNLLISDFKNRLNAERIFACLGNGKKRYGELEKALKLDRTGNLNRQLKILTDMEIITKSNPINKPDDTKKTMYSIDDNLLRFYYSFIYKNKSALQMLGAEAFYDEYIEPRLYEFISHRFKHIGRTYFSLLAKKGKLQRARNIGALYYDDPVNKKNGEFDIAIEYADCYDIIEVKYYREKLGLGEMRKEAAQVTSIPDLSVRNIGFISANGFEEVGSFKPCLSAEDLYDESLL